MLNAVHSSVFPSCYCLKQVLIHQIVVQGQRRNGAIVLVTHNKVVYLLATLMEHNPDSVEQSFLKWFMQVASFIAIGGR